MATVQLPVGANVRPLVVIASVLVAASTPLNLLLLLLCRGLTGDNAGRDLSGGPVLLGAVVNVGLFLVVCGLALLACGRASAFWRWFAVVTALVLHLGLWLCGSLALVAVVVATDYAQ